MKNVTSSAFLEGNRLASHIKGFNLIEVFNNLALCGEKKFVGELKRTYKFQRGANNILDCHANQTRTLSKEYSFVAGDYVRSTARNDVKRHTEDNSPKYRMVANDVGLESPTSRNNCGEYRKTVITRSDKRRSNRILLIPHLEIKDFGPPASGGHGSYHCLTNVVNRLRNKCAMTSVGDMKENNFFDKVFSCFTSHFSLKQSGATHVALCDSVGSYYRHWCRAFTLAEVLITLGIIGVVAALTLPTLISNYKKQTYVTGLQKAYSVLNNMTKPL